MLESKQHDDRQLKIGLHTDAQISVEKHDLIDLHQDLATQFAPKAEAFEEKQENRETEKEQEDDENELEIDHGSR